MSKVDFKRELKHLYHPTAEEFTIVDVPVFNYLMIDGQGDPNTEQSYQNAIDALYAVAYKIKFMSKQQLDRDYVVPPLEGLWWAEDMETFNTAKDKSAWIWTMMIMQPDWVTPEMFEDARSQVGRKKDLLELPNLRLEKYREGLCIQIMHIGTYEDEAPTLVKMHQEFIPNNGFEMAGKHHEIYLGDPRKVAAEKLKTVLRQPVRRA
jgi:hypothetical protein